MKFVLNLFLALILCIGILSILQDLIETFNSGLLSNNHRNLATSEKTTAVRPPPGIAPSCPANTILAAFEGKPVNQETYAGEYTNLAPSRIELQLITKNRDSSLRVDEKNAIPTYFPIHRHSKSWYCLNANAEYMLLPKSNTDWKAYQSMKWRICEKVLTMPSSNHIIKINTNGLHCLADVMESPISSSMIIKSTEKQIADTVTTIDCSDEPTSRPTSMPTIYIGKYDFIVIFL
jgi:hypothetical protein